MDNLKIGIIGTGSISDFHIKAYKKCPNVQVVACCDINGARVREFAKTHDIPNFYTNYDDMLSRDDIEAVSITTWNNVHCPATVAALKAGKNVLCEKPLALSAEEARLMNDEAKKAGKLLMVGFVRRFGENTKALKTFIDNGNLGNIYYSKVSFIRRWGNPGGWFSDKKRSGGGALIDIGVHGIDLARYLSGNPKPISAYAATFSHHGMKPNINGVEKYKTVDYNDFCDVEDGATALVRFDNGMITFIETTWVENANESINISFYGDKSGAQLEPVLEIHEDRNGYLTDVTPKLKYQEANFEDVFCQEINHFVDCVKKDTKCMCPGEDGYELMKILDAIYESAETRHEVIIK